MSLLGFCCAFAIKIVYECGTCTAACCSWSLLEACVVADRARNAEREREKKLICMLTLPACVFIVKLCGDAGAAEPQHTNHCYRLSQCKGCGGQGSGRRPRHGGREEDGCLGVQSGEQGRMPHVWFIACRVEEFTDRQIELLDESIALVLLK